MMVSMENKQVYEVIKKFVLWGLHTKTVTGDWYG